MTKVNVKLTTKHVVMSATLALIATLAACSKPGDAVIPAKPSTAPSPLADPAKAGAENKANEDKIKAAADAPNATAEDKAKKDEKAKELNASLEKMSAAIEKEKGENNGVVAAEAAKQATTDALNGTPVSSVPGASTSGTSTVTAGTVAPGTTQTAPSSSVASAAAPSDASGDASGTTPNTNAATNTTSPATPSADAAAVATAPVPVPVVGNDASAPAPTMIDADKRAFIISMILPSMGYNFNYAQNRQKVEALQKTASQQPNGASVIKSEEFQRILKEADLKEGASFDEVLARVDMVNLSFIIPYIMMEANEQMADAKGHRSLLRVAMAKFNTSNEDSVVRFRNARQQMRKTNSVMSSVDLMKAYLGVSDENAMSAVQTQSLNLVKEVMKVLAEPDAQKEINNVKAQLQAKIDIFAAPAKVEEVTRP